MSSSVAGCRTARVPRIVCNPFVKYLPHPQCTNTNCGRIGKPNFRSMRGKSRIQVSVIAVAVLFLGACAGSSGISNSDNAIIKATVLTEDPAAAGPVSVNLSAVADIDGIVNTGSPVPTAAAWMGDGNAGLRRLSHVVHRSSGAAGDVRAWVRQGRPICGEQHQGGAAGGPFFERGSVRQRYEWQPGEPDLHRDLHRMEPARASCRTRAIGVRPSTIRESRWWRPCRTGSRRAERLRRDLGTCTATRFPINGAKTVQSITLPANRNVVVFSNHSHPCDRLESRVRSTHLRGRGGWHDG